MTEGHVEYLIIGVLNPIGNNISLRTHLVGLDDEHLEEGDDRHGEEE